ncbi:uncharacterized protein FPRO_11962 [Fusarium proliferatum ET1]|uniref:HNH nuclease domain-containing protein n=2 Tax=Gibberella intermedia TaxID=948311 RepID=A0A1L7W1I8_FUSPR|nr:uncharacterized protein FPRO_11962 [Fusarium proliferatum ET1]CZR46513.1 uncharacterized protein FPRO_11962 [Fusarium proliferatum ET1]
MTRSMPIRQSQHQPAHLLPLEEIDERIRHAKTIQSLIRGCCRTGLKDFRLRAEHVAAIMTIPLSLFGPNGLMSERILDFEMQKFIDAISPSCKYYLRHLRKRHRETFVSDQLGQPSVACPSTVSHGSSRMDIDETTSFEVKSEASLKLQIIEPPSSAGSESEYTDELQAVELPRIDKHTLDVAEQTKCLARDGNICVVTGAKYPNAYHIAPFTWNDTQEHIDRTFDLGPHRTFLVGKEFANRTRYLNNRDKPGESDKAWNMISLHPQVYSWWSKGYIAFKCLEVQSLGNGESNVVLEFRWMPQTKRWFGQQIDIFNTGTGHDLKEWFNEIDQFHTPGNPPPKARDGMRIRATTSDGAPLCSGKLIVIRMQTGEASRFKDMIDMQWGCILVTALSGAAGISQLLSDSNSDDKVMQWIQNQANFAEEHELDS